MKLKHVCLIGGSGFIGSKIAHHFLEKRTVSVIDLFPPPADIKVNFIKGDYSDPVFLEQALRNVDEIIYLAYASVPKTSSNDSYTDIAQNLPSALTLFTIAAKLPIKKMIVFSSGGAVYGKKDSMPINEDASTNPISSYGITKLTIEKYALLFHELHQLPVVILRPGNAYGEGQRPYTGQGLVATTAASLLDQKPIILFGKEGAIRDYIHVDDIAKATLSALDKGLIGSYYNVGTGTGTSSRHIIDSLMDISGTSCPIEIRPARQFDVPANILDSRKLTNETGWKPTINLDHGLHRTWQWFKEHYAPS